MKYLLGLSLLFISVVGMASPGDTVRVTTHDGVIVRTNPSAGNASYPAWAEFPAAGTSIHKAWIELDYRCPIGENCGEWDYLDYIFLRRKGGVAGVSEDIELARFITPYGNSYSATWRADWQVDVTDFEQLLRDSIEIDYIHGGYETNVGKGWLVTLKFCFIEGTPIRDLKSVHRLWNGGFSYGNTSNPINDQLPEQNFSTGDDAGSLRFRIIQSGHGADSPDYCAEFCPKLRSIYRNQEFVDERLVWRDDCGLNPVFPQAGTWIYDRGNWCPGDIVYPDVYDFVTAPQTTETFSIEMQSYTGTGGANYVIQAYALEYGNPNFGRDAGITDVLKPSTRSSYKRFNPICGKPEIEVMNTGAETISSLLFEYGPQGGITSNYTWSGNIESMQKTKIELPANVNWGAAEGIFTVTIVEVNGQADEYALNNSFHSAFESPLDLPEKFVVNFKTNNAPEENEWTIYDAEGNSIISRSNFSANTEYKDTIELGWGCYRFVLEDSDKDGISFWANDDGSGFIRFRKADLPTIIKAYGADFGTRLEVPFTVGGSLGYKPVTDKQSELTVYPNPSHDQIQIEFIQAQQSEITVILRNLSGQEIYSKEFPATRELKIQENVSQLPAGLYILEVQGSNSSAYRKIAIQK